MFQLPLTSDGSTGRPTQRQLLRRAGWFLLGLVVLWLVLQFAAPAPSGPENLYSDGSGTVVTKTPTTLPERSSGIRPGYVLAVLLLAGGAWYAMYLRKRNPVAGAPEQSIQLLGKVQISPAQHLRLVSCGGEVLLLGVTSSQITLLKGYPASTFDVPAEEEQGDAASYTVKPVLSKGSTHGSFADVLSQFADPAVTNRFREGQHG